MVTGQCPCFAKYKSLRCNECSEGRFGFPDCQGTYDVNSTLPQALIFQGFRTHFHLVPYGTIIEYLSESTTNDYGHTSMPDDIEGVDMLYLGRDDVTNVPLSPSFNYLNPAMVVSFNGSCIYCHDEINFYRNRENYTCYSVKPIVEELPSTGALGLTGTPVLAQGFSSEETSYFVGMEDGIYSFRSDYHVDVLKDINKPWQNVRSSNSSLEEHYGRLRCMTKVNETSFVGISRRVFIWSDYYVYYDKDESLWMMFFNLQESIWMPGMEIHSGQNYHSIFNCQVHRGRLTFELTLNSGDDYFKTFDVNPSDSRYPSYPSMSRIDSIPYGTLVELKDGFLYAGGVTNRAESRALLYKHNDLYNKKEWLELNQRLRRDDGVVRPAICVF